MNTQIYRTTAGSFLFGTSTPSSDRDYKSVHLPDARSILLGTANKVSDRSTGGKNRKNSADDVDETSFPLQKYLKNLASMETNAIEILFSYRLEDFPDDGTFGWYIWNEIYQNRMRILNTNKQSFLGYAKAQAMRYSVRGERLKALKAIIDFLKSQDASARIRDLNLSAVLWEFEGIRVYDRQIRDQNGSFYAMPHICVHGRQTPITSTVSEALKVYEKPLKNASHRAEAAVEDGVDWKGMYHAQRIVHEGIELFSTGNLVFPCRHAPYYLDIRNGVISLDEVLNRFDESLLELEGIDPAKHFRSHADHKWIDEFVYAAHEQQVVSAYESNIIQEQ
jgi:hypothetical protein